MLSYGAGMIGFLEGAMMHGIFHGDLHAGNLLILASGKIALLDFGITARLSEAKRLALLSLIVGASNGHIPSQVAALRDLGALPPSTDVDTVIANWVLTDPRSIRPHSRPTSWSQSCSDRSRRCSHWAPGCPRSSCCSSRTWSSWTVPSPLGSRPRPLRRDRNNLPDVRRKVR